MKNIMIIILSILFFGFTPINRDYLGIDIGISPDEFVKKTNGKEVTDNVFHIKDERIFEAVDYKNGVNLHSYFYKGSLYRVDIEYPPDCLPCESVWDDEVKVFFKIYRDPALNNEALSVWNDGKTELILFKKSKVIILRDNSIADIIERNEENELSLI